MTTANPEILPWRGHLRATVVLGLPLIGSHIAQMLTHITDVIMLGWYSVDALAAVVLAAHAFFVVFIVGSGFAFAVMPLVAEAVGGDNPRQVRRTVRMGTWLVMGYGAVMLVPLLLMEQVLLTLGQDAGLSKIAGEYMWIAAYSLFPGLLIMVLKSYLSALERANIVLFATLVAALANVFFNYALIFGNFGMPELGARGAAWATVLTTTVDMLFILGYALWLPALRRFEVFVNFFQPDWQALVTVFRLGWPIGLTMLAEAGLFSAATLMVGWTDTLTLAAHGIVVQIISILFMVPLGLSNVATIRAGNALGRHDGFGMHRVAMTVFGAAMALSVVGIVILLTLPDPLIRLFITPNEQQIATIVLIGTGMMVIAAVFQIMDGAQVVFLGLLRGVQDTTVPMVIAVISYWVLGLPLGYYLGFIAGWGATGVWWGLVVGLAGAAVGLMLRWYQVYGRLSAGWS